MNVTATHINYYFTCRRKLWLFSHNIKCEQESELVKIGKIHHEDLEKNAIQIENIRLDGLRGGKVFELKKKNTAPEAARHQVLFYLLKLKEKGIITQGIIKYKENNRLETVELTNKNEESIKKAIKEAEEISIMPISPETKRIKYCKKCSYYELCFS